MKSPLYKRFRGDSYSKSTVDQLINIEETILIIKMTDSLMPNFHNAVAPVRLFHGRVAWRRCAWPYEEEWLQVDS
jgi:hypothetical protein